METKTQAQIQQEITEVNDQFNEFLKTKGLVAKFKLAFNNMAESARIQHQKDVDNFNKVKQQSAEQNKDFNEFLQTKGLKAKFNLVIENIKKGAREASKKTAEQIAQVKAQTNANIAKVNGTVAPASADITAETLTEEFNAFLKSKGLADKYTVVITEE